MVSIFYPEDGSSITYALGEHMVSILYPEDGGSITFEPLAKYTSLYCVINQKIII
jgi:hypothetical protein